MGKESLTIRGTCSMACKNVKPVQKLLSELKNIPQSVKAIIAPEQITLNVCLECNKVLLPGAMDFFAKSNLKTVRG